MTKIFASAFVPVLFPMLLGACAAEDDELIEMADFDPAAGLAEQAPTGRAIIRTADGEREVGYDVVGGRALLEGDIDLGPVELLRAPGEGAPRSNPNLLGSRWPNGTVPFVTPSFNTAAIKAAIADLDAKTDLKFVEFPVALPGINMIVFTPSLDPGVSSSSVGMQGGIQYVKIWATHGASVVEHELMHAVGVWHEQQRLDRDTFININWFCMPQSRWHNFDKAGVPAGGYDFKSIMHYGSFSFSSIDGCPVMTKKDGTTFSSSSSLSAGDIAGVNLMY